MQTCSQNVQDISCSLVAIHDRLVPIDYENNILNISTPIVVEKQLLIDSALIVNNDSVLDLPAKTLINGVPLISDAFSTISLPSETMWNGYTPTIEQYFNFFMSSSSTFLNIAPNGYMINGTIETISSPVSDLRGFPFIAPEDCVLTSFKVYYILTAGTFGTPGDGYISLDVVDTNSNPFFTGISYNIIKPASNSQTFYESQFEYFVKKGDSVGVYVSGTSQFQGGVSVYAVLGYRIIPPSLLSSEFPLKTSFRAQSERSPYNRFPFNSIMNFHAQVPIRFEDQLEIISSHQENLYGRSLTKEDYDLRCVLPRTGSSAKQDAIVFLLNNYKQNGYYIDFSIERQNTFLLEKDYGWKGLVLNPLEQNNNDYKIVLSQQEIPSVVDYLSFDWEDGQETLQLFEMFFPILDSYQFHVLTIRHENDPNVQSRTGNILLLYQYVILFKNIMIKRNDCWSISEDWYVHPALLLPEVLEKITSHPENHENIHSTKCVEILSSIFS
jgi:hypothetical protein